MRSFVISGLLALLILLSGCNREYEYVISGTDNLPVRAIVKVWNNGSIESSTTVDDDGNFYLSFTHDEKTLVIDSLQFSKMGYVRETYADLELTTGALHFAVDLEHRNYDFTLFGTQSAPMGMLVEVWKDGELLGSDMVNKYEEYSCRFKFDEQVIVVDSIRYFYKRFVPHTLYESVLGPSTMYDVVLVMPECEVGKYGHVTIWNDTGKPLWVDCTDITKQANDRVKLASGEVKQYRMPEGDLYIWGSLNGYTWNSHSQYLEACENLNFIWFLDAKKGSEGGIELRQIQEPLPF